MKEEVKCEVVEVIMKVSGEGVGRLARQILDMGVDRLLYAKHELDNMVVVNVRLQNKELDNKAKLSIAKKVESILNKIDWERLPLCAHDAHVLRFLVPAESGELEIIYVED